MGGGGGKNIKQNALKRKEVGPFGGRRTARKSRIVIVQEKGVIMKTKTGTKRMERKKRGKG